MKTVKDETVELVFTNLDAKPKVQTITCSLGSCPSIAAWYGSYFAGDRYSISIDGDVIQKNQTGELTNFD